MTLKIVAGRDSISIVCTETAAPGSGKGRPALRGLRGLRGVQVVVEDLEPEIEAAGLTRAAIQTDAEVKLRLAGMTVLSEAEMLNTPGVPYLYINANVLPAKRLWAFNLDLSLNQGVLLERDARLPGMNAATWGLGRLGTAPVSDGAARIRGEIQDLLNIFINAWLTVNPRR